MTGFVSMLYFLSQNLKSTGFIILLILLGVGGGSWWFYDSTTKSIDNDINSRKLILTELYKGTNSEVKPQSITPAEMTALFDVTFGIVNPGYKPLVSYSTILDRFQVKSGIKILTRTLRRLQDDSYAAKFDFPDIFSLPVERAVASVNIPDNSGFFNSLGYFSFKLKMEKIKLDGDAKSIFGVAFNQFYLIISKGEIKLFKKEAEDKGDKNPILQLWRDGRL
ncbi:hypothetical protein MASR1M107_14830 [Ignavibacteriales bacterium]